MEFYNEKVLRRRNVIWQQNHEEDDSAVYSDRLWQWDSEKYDRCCMGVWGNRGQMFYDRKPEEIQRFLSLYLGKEVVLTQIKQEQNASSGYDYWLFCYRER